MKTVRTLSLLAILSMLGFISCSKKADDVTPGQTGTSPAGFRVNVDGVDYAPDFAYALTSFPGANGYYAIYGLDSKTNNMVAMALPSTSAEGTYTLDNVSFGMISYNKEDYSTINGGTGTITITKKTATNLVGTFSFTAYDATNTKKRVLKDGTFNVTVRQ